MRVFCLCSVMAILILLSPAIGLGEPGETRIGNHELGVGYFMIGGGTLTGGSSGAATTLGGGGHSVAVSGLILGGEGHSVFSDEGAGGLGFFDIGYAAVRRGNLIVYPMLGLGGGSLARDSDDTVSQVLLIDGSVGADYLIPLGAEGGLTIGMRVGYTASVYSTEWHWQLPHARLMVGGYGIKE